MKTIKVSEATEIQIDWLVAKCEGIPLGLAPFRGAKNFVMLGQNMKPTYSKYTPTISWAQGGPIIERETLEIVPICPGTWRAIAMTRDWYNGRTPLEAAMRCYVASKLGDEVDVPEELT